MKSINCATQLPNYFNPKTQIRRLLVGAYYCLISELRIQSTTRRLIKMWKKTPSPFNREAIIIAGGPSFNSEVAKSIIDSERKFDIFSINNYCQNNISQDLVPDYYILSDPVFFKSGYQGEFSDNDSIQEYTSRHSRIKMIVPINCWVNRYSKKPFVAFDDRENLLSANIDPCLPRGYTSNTTLKALAIALKLGYDRIFILGFDFDYPNKIRVDESNRLTLLNQHHYSTVLSDFNKYYSGIGHALNWWSHDYYYAIKLNRKGVINVTTSSLMDAFERMKCDDFLTYLKYF